MGADDGEGEGMWLSIKAFWLNPPIFIILPFRTFPRFFFLNLSLIACLGTEAGGRLMEGRWGGGGGGYKRRTVEGVSQSGKRGRDITTKGSAGKHWFWGNMIFF